MRLTFVIEGLGGGGAQRVLALLSATMAARGHTVSVVTYGDPARDQIALDPRIERRSADLAGTSYGVLDAITGNLLRVRALRRMVRESRADVVIAFVGTTNILTILACAGLGLPVVISERNDPAHQSLGRAWDFLRRLTYRRARIVTANSPGALDALARYVPRSKLVHIPNPLVKPSSQNKPDSDDRFVLAVGRLHPQKGFDVLLDAFAVFAVDRPGWRLEVLGDGPERAALIAQAEVNGIADRIGFPGFTDPESHYCGCAMYVQSSRHEGTSNALLEAMGHGCAIVTTGRPGQPLDPVVDGDNARVVAPESADALAQAMSEMADDAELARRLGSAARAAVADLDPDRIADRWIDLFAGLVR